MQSMTGFGRAEKKTKAGVWTAEISTVNNRYLEYTIRLPRHLNALEMPIRQLLAEQLNRGKITLTVNFEEAEESDGRYPINKAAARAYFRQLESIRKELKLKPEISINDLLALPAVSLPEKEEAADDRTWKALQPVIAKAVKELSSMRAKEGEAMARDMKQRLALAKDLISKVEKQTPEIVKALREKLLVRVKELMTEPIRDEVRLEEEIAYIADRTDVSEECTRFRSHLDQYAETLKRKEPVGKRLNFILQEMNREVNTIGSKCSDIAISSIVIQLKEEVEKLREQVQNVE